MQKIQIKLKLWMQKNQKKLNPFGAVGKYIYHLFSVKFLGLEGKRNPKYFQSLKR